MRVRRIPTEYATGRIAELVWQSIGVGSGQGKTTLTGIICVVPAGNEGLKGGIRMKTPNPREFQVTHVRPVETTPNGNTFVECNTSSGTVAFWGDDRSMANIEAIQSKRVPFRVRTGCIEPNAPFDQQHRLWVPQSARVEFL